MFIAPVTELIPKNTELKDEVVVFIEPVVELILKNTESNEDVVVLIEPVVELICLLTKSCDELCVFIAPVTELIPRNTESKDDVVVFIEPVVLAILKLTANWDAVNSLIAPAPIDIPFILTLPLNWCVSSPLLPKIVLPLSKITDADVISVNISCAVNFPFTTKLPPTDALPLTVDVPLTDKFALIVWFAVNILAEPVCAEYWLVYLLKSCIVIFSVIPSCTIGTNTIEPDIVVIKGNSDIFLSAIFSILFCKVGLQLL